MTARSQRAADRLELERLRPVPRRVIPTAGQEQLPLALPAGRKPRARARVWPPRLAPSWSNTTRREKCDDCLLECSRDPAAPAARKTRRRFRDPAAGIDLLLCYDHAQKRGDALVPRPRRAAR